jgi:hypothetical protein
MAFGVERHFGAIHGYLRRRFDDQVADWPPVSARPECGAAEAAPASRSRSESDVSEAA